ncbi:MAG TPA: HDOD domain-containing protein [Opitutaceae bacterium]|nr:HDOD domain-containing protein [Opitutaceae bacterium]
MSVALALTRDRILDHARALPAAPRVMAELCELLQDINTDLDQIAIVIRADPALAARVIRISNSIVYGGEWQVSSIDDAVNRVGFEEVLRLVGTASVAGFVDRELAIYGLDAETLRSSLLLHALASEALARHTAVDTRTAYTAGLLRALGMMVMDRVARGQLVADLAYDSQAFSTYLDWEKARFGIGSPDVTRMVLDEWRFPHEIVTAIEEHLLDTAGWENPFAALLNVAGAIVAGADLALPGDRKHWVLTPDKLSAAGLTDAQFQASAADALVQFERQRAAL